MQQVPDILARIVEAKRRVLPQLVGLQPELERQAEAYAETRRNFRQALLSQQPAIIAEIKKASPSAGVIARAFDPVRIARAYQQGGAAALSVLTDEEFFQGSLADLMAVRTHVELPVLRKDFTISEFHVIEAAAHGADAVLLIAAILSAEQIRQLQLLAAQYRMDALVEVHDEEDLVKALAAGAQLIGVNNRNLHTFEVSLETSLRLAEKIPDGVVKVSESGIQSSEDIRRLQQAGFQAFLVGEHLMRSPDPRAALEQLRA